MEFYDVHEESKYSVTISRPESVEELSDFFMTKEELEDLCGSFYCGTNRPKQILLTEVITKELEKWADKLEASNKKTLKIEDEDLLDVLKNNPVTNFIDGKYGRHGDRICYSRRYKRVKKKPTRTDVREFWLHIFPYAFRHKFGAYPPYHTTYDRHLAAFKAWQKCVGWKACSKYMSDPAQKKFYKMIWDNPAEYV